MKNVNFFFTYIFNNNLDSLKIPFTGDITLNADEIWGILRGLDTLSQLIFLNNKSVCIL